MKYKVIRYYRRSHEQEFASLAEAKRAIEAHALTSSACCYTELWQMTDESSGEHMATYDYGASPAIELIPK